MRTGDEGVVALPYEGARYRLVPHASDAAIEVEAPAFPDLVTACLLAVSDAAWGLSTLDPRDETAFDVPAGDPEMQLFQALAEALFLADARDLLAARAAVRVRDDGSLGVALSCDRLDPARHRPRARFKAVTMHGMQVRRTRTGLRVTVVLDV